MYVLILKYIKPICEIDKEVERHRVFLDKYYSKGNFICSGAQVPRAGGIIISNAESITEIKDIIKEDPFLQKELVEYQIIEFQTTKYGEGFERFINK